MVVLVVAGAPVGGQATVEPYDGLYVSLDLDDNAVTGYAVGDQVVAASIHASSAGQPGAGDANLSNLTNLEGEAFDDQQVGETTATMSTPTAQLQAHDNPRGIFTVRPTAEPQYVRIELPDGAETVEEDNGTVTYRTDEGVAASVVVVGDGEVTIEEGNVLARLVSESQLVMRTAPDGPSEEFTGQNELVADGLALAEVYVVERDPDVVTDTVVYDRGTTVTGSRSAESAIAVTVERGASDGGVVIAAASRSIVPAEGVNVTVDDESIERADGYDELGDAVENDRLQFALTEGSAIDATSVAVAVGEFPDSSRRIGVSSGPPADGGGGNGGQSELGAPAAVIGLAGAAFLVRYR